MPINWRTVESNIVVIRYRSSINQNCKTTTYRHYGWSWGCVGTGINRYSAELVGSGSFNARGISVAVLFAPNWDLLLRTSYRMSYAYVLSLMSAAVWDTVGQSKDKHEGTVLFALDPPLSQTRTENSLDLKLDGLKSLSFTSPLLLLVRLFSGILSEVGNMM